MARKRNPHSHLTAKERDRPSFPTRKLLEMGRIRGRVLDYGCGHGADVRFLSQRGFDAVGYDPHYAPDLPSGPFDTVLCHYVLNVLFPEEQTDVLMNVSELTAEEGSAYFAVRRDLRRPGFRMHRKHRKQTYQCNVRLPYESVLLTKFCEVYEYNRVRHLEDGSPCAFCRSETVSGRLITESAQAYAIYDKFPVTEGHALVIPKRHVESYFDLSVQEQRACWLVVNRVKSLLDSRYGSPGYNVGINDGEAGGQTIPHAHIHVIPRYEGDVPNPRGGVRHVIPSKADYVSDREAGVSVSAGGG
jgi:diadenosine tetraphosphate (Ap4A) HIT family hydrolase